MAVGHAHSIALIGLDGHLVEVEADLAPGIPAFVVLGLADAELREVRDRVRAAVVNSGCTWPQCRVTVALSPAALPKRGSSFDLAMAVAVLAASGQVPAVGSDTVFLGELSLDGSVRPIPGVLPAVRAALRAGVRRAVVPAANAREAELVPGVDVMGVTDLRGVLAYLVGGDRTLTAAAAPSPPGAASVPDVEVRDLDVGGEGRRYLEVAAAGGHNLFLVGAAGSGTTALAEQLRAMLPRLDQDAALEVSAIHSVAGTLPRDAPLMTSPPLRAPHHTATLTALIGGGSGIARPGEVSLAHCGVLLVEDAPEFAPGHLDALRHPLESGTVTIARSGGVARYPARFLLVLTATPCPCGGAGRDACTCVPGARRRHLARIPGPLLDRLDIHVHVEHRPSVGGARSGGESAERVAAARERMAYRYRDTPWSTNGEVPARQMRQCWPLSDALAPAHAAVDAGRLSARGLDRVVRVAWTLADLDGRATPATSHVRGALALRRAAP